MIKHITMKLLKKAVSRNLKLITRMPETTTLAKDCISGALNHKCEMKADEKKIRKSFEESCTFILCSNNLNLKAEDLLKEYKC